MVLYYLEVICFGLTGVGFLCTCIGFSILALRLIDQQQKINKLELKLDSLTPAEKPRSTVAQGKKKA